MGRELHTSGAAYVRAVDQGELEFTRAFAVMQTLQAACSSADTMPERMAIAETIGVVLCHMRGIARAYTEYRETKNGLANVTPAGTA